MPMYMLGHGPGPRKNSSSNRLGRGERERIEKVGIKKEKDKERYGNI